MAEEVDVFVYKNLKIFLYIFMATAAICGAGFQLSNFYLSKQSSNQAQEIIGYLITDGEPVLIKKAQSQAGTLAMHGQIVLADDSIKTLEASTVLEIGKHKFRILPQSDVIIKRNLGKIEFYVTRGLVVALSAKAVKAVTLFEQNDSGQFGELAMQGPLVPDPNAIFKLNEISLKVEEQGSKLEVTWSKDESVKNRWVEFWAGTDKNNLQLIKAYPFETGGFSEDWSMTQFFWQTIVKENDAALETGAVSFWKNEFQSKINLIYPNDKEVVNNVINPDDFVLKWSKAANVDKVKVQIFKNNVMISEVLVGNKNQMLFKPSEFGFYYWRVLNEDHSIYSESRAFYFAPIAEGTADVMSWHETAETEQFYYREPILHLQWQKNSRWPVGKYKVTLIYLQENKAGDLSQVKENFFVEREELNVRIDTATPVKVKVEPYNHKMQVLGKPLEQEIKLSKRSTKQLLTFAKHGKTGKKDIITDRSYSLNVDPKSISSLYDYHYEVTAPDKKVVKKGVISKGDKINFKGLATDYYQVKFRVEDRKLTNYFESQNLLPASASKGRVPASQNSQIEQAISIKLIPPTDYNVTKEGIITPQVENVEIKN